MKLLKVGKAGLLDWEGLVKVSVWVTFHSDTLAYHV